eukprot:scaffold37508_cov17-Prasinocladus_malaysianus.AAC.2
MLCGFGAHNRTIGVWDGPLLSGAASPIGAKGAASPVLASFDDLPQSWGLPSPPRETNCQGSSEGVAVSMVLGHPQTRKRTVNFKAESLLAAQNLSSCKPSSLPFFLAADTH